MKDNLPQKVDKHAEADKLFQKLIEDDTMKKIGGRIQNGLKVREACLLANLDKNQINLLLQFSEGFNEFCEIQQIKFKEKQLSTITNTANAKTAQWLLESLEPETFGKAAKKKGDVGNENEHVVHAIIKTIQRSDDPLVTDVEYKEETKNDNRDARPQTASKKAGSVLD